MSAPPSPPFRDSIEHLLAELERIDLLIRLDVRRSRALHGPDDQFQGLYVSDEEVDQLLNKPLGMPRAMATGGVSAFAEAQPLLVTVRDGCSARKAAALAVGVSLRLEQLAERFNLLPFDIDCILICLAPELDLRYERFYAYLQDDVTRKRPSVDLVLNLLCGSLPDRLTGRGRFSNDAPLLHWKILQVFEESQNSHAPLLAQHLKLDDRISSWLLGSDSFDSRLQVNIRNVDEASAPERAPESAGEPHSDVAAHVERSLNWSREGRAVLYLQAANDSGGEQLATSLCKRQKRELLVADGPQLVKIEGLDFAIVVRLVVREAILADAALYWEGFDALLADDKRSTAWSTLSRVRRPSCSCVPGRGDPLGTVRSSSQPAIHENRAPPPRSTAAPPTLDQGFGRCRDCEGRFDSVGGEVPVFRRAD